MTQRDKEEAGMKGTGRARARNQTICLCSDPYGHAEVWLGKRRAHTDFPYPVFPPTQPCQPGGGQAMYTWPQPSQGSEQPRR